MDTSNCSQTSLLDDESSSSSRHQIDDDGARHVHFSVVEEFEYEKPDYSEEEIANLWYTMEEMVGLVKYELKICEENNKKEGRCWRGLEHMKGGTDNRAERVSEITDGILDAYDELSYDSDMYKNENDRDEALRAECRARTRDDRKRAYKFGLRDATVAEEIFKEDEVKKSSSSGRRGSNESKPKTRRSGRKSSPRDRRVKRSRSNHGDGDDDEMHRKRSHSPRRPERVAPAPPMASQTILAVGA